MVNVLRSQSIYHAIASGMKNDSEPALIILRPETSYLSFNTEPENEGLEQQFLTDNDIPQINRKIAAGNFYHDPNQLLLMFVFSNSRCDHFGSNESMANLTQAVILAFNKLGVTVKYNPDNRFYAGSKEIGMASLGLYNNTFSFFSALNLDKSVIDQSLLNSKLLPGNIITSVAEELGKVPSLEGSAEALLSSFEEIFDLALIPSMPMPEEMDLIYDWDAKLINNKKIKQKNLQNSSGLKN
ncbi:MAG: hypothetical protein HND50_16815 [Calditrichaeota bacterium]|nr:hypothetical protein [Calditrichota bacterium]